MGRVELGMEGVQAAGTSGGEDLPEEPPEGRVHGELPVAAVRARGALQGEGAGGQPAGEQLAEAGDRAVPEFGKGVTEAGERARPATPEKEAGETGEERRLLLHRPPSTNYRDRSRVELP